MGNMRTPFWLSWHGELRANGARNVWPAKIRSFAGKFSLLGCVLLLLASTGMDENLEVQIPLPPSGQKYLIYELGKPDLTASDAARIARGAGFTQVKPQTGNKTKGEAEGVVLFVDRSHVTRMIFVPATGGLEWLPNLATQNQQAPSVADSTARAQAWITASGLLGKNEPGWQAQGVTTLSRQAFHRGGGHLAAIRAIQTVSFSREIGGLPVEGPNSVMAVNVGSRGVVGVSRILLPIQRTAIPVEFKSAEEVRQEFHQALSQVVSPQSRAEVNSVKLVYYEQGGQYVQPAYRFLVTVVSPKGAAVGHRILIAAAKNSPEAILPLASIATSILPASHGGARLRHTGGSGTPDPTIQFGFYFDRLDWNEWASDPWRFWENFASTLTAMQIFDIGWPPQPPRGFSANLKQFQFDFPWMWQRGSNYNDFSSQFIDLVHFAMVTGHGSPFSMVTLQDYADPILVQQSKGFGAFNGNKNALTDYIVWRGCCVVTSPDPADADPSVCNSSFTSDPVGPWFNLFEGLRGTYGYHTQMAIQAEEGPLFGQLLPFGFGGSPILSTWMTSVANATNGTCATQEFDCASAVIVTGHENDTVFDLGPVQSPQNLTIWWQSPGSPNNSSSVAHP